MQTKCGQVDNTSDWDERASVINSIQATSD